MITRKNLYKLCDKYIREVISGPLGPSDLKHKGIFHWVNQFPMAQHEPMFEPPNPISVSFSVGRIEIETRLNNMAWVYETRVRFSYKSHVHVVAFEIPKEAWSRQTLEHHFKDYCDILEVETGLIKLTPEEEMAKEYKEAKKAAFAAMYEVEQYGKFDMKLFKKQIEDLKNKTSTPKQWVVQSPDGNMHVASLDAGSQVLHNITAQANAAKAKEIHMGMSTFNQVKKLAEKYFAKNGKFPDPDSFIGMGMQVVVDPGVPDGAVVFHTAQPPKHHPKTVESYTNSGNELAQLIPALSHMGIPCPEPADCSGWGHTGPNATLANLIIHLNDSHRWPRSATDPNPHNKPNIADWIDEVCLIHGLDQSFHPKKEKKPTVRDWAVKKEKGKIELSHSYVDEPVVIDEEWLNKYEQKLFKGFSDKYLKMSKLEGWINDGD